MCHNDDFEEILAESSEVAVGSCRQSLTQKRPQKKWALLKLPLFAVTRRARRIRSVSVLEGRLSIKAKQILNKNCLKQAITPSKTSYNPNLSGANSTSKRLNPTAINSLAHETKFCRRQVSIKQCELLVELLSVLQKIFTGISVFLS